MDRRKFLLVASSLVTSLIAAIYGLNRGNLFPDNSGLNQSGLGPKPQSNKDDDMWAQYDSSTDGEDNISFLVLIPKDWHKEKLSSRNWLFAPRNYLEAGHFPEQLTVTCHTLDWSRILDKYGITGSWNSGYYRSGTTGPKQIDGPGKKGILFSQDIRFHVEDYTGQDVSHTLVALIQHNNSAVEIRGPQNLKDEFEKAVSSFKIISKAR